MLPNSLGLLTGSAAAPLVSGSYQLNESFFLTYFCNPPPPYYVSYWEQLLVLLFFQICFPFVHLLCSSLFTPFLTISLPQLRISAPHTVLKAPFLDKLFGTLSSSCYPSINFLHDTVWFMCHMYQLSPSVLQDQHSQCNLNATQLSHLLQPVHI